VKKFLVCIKGIRPLLQNKFRPESIEGPSKKQVGSVKDVEPKEKLYTFDDGTIYQPAEHILRAMYRVASNFKIRGRGKKTYKDIVLSQVFIEPECIPHKIQKWEVDERPVVIKATKGRIMRRRPLFPEWELEFTMTLGNDLPPETAKEILDYAGRYNGIGDYRPRFGLFIVTKWEELKD